MREERERPKGQLAGPKTAGDRAEVVGSDTEPETAPQTGPATDTARADETQRDGSELMRRSAPDAVPETALQTGPVTDTARADETQLDGSVE
jgi:hypothetical protein